LIELPVFGSEVESERIARSGIGARETSTQSRLDEASGPGESIAYIPALIAREICFVQTSGV
jgi:hypothetical protein